MGVDACSCSRWPWLSLCLHLSEQMENIMMPMMKEKESDTNYERMSERDVDRRKKPNVEIRSNLR